MIFIESRQDIAKFLDYFNSQPSYIHPIWCDLDKHPMHNNISFLYVRFKSEDGNPLDFIVPYDHNDCMNVQLYLSKSEEYKKVVGKKALSQTNLKLKNLVDIESELFFYEYEKYSEGLPMSKIDDLTNLWKRNGFTDDLGKIIPIQRWGEVLRGISDDIGVEDLLNIDEFDILSNWVDQTMIPVLGRIEKHGLTVDVEKFKDKWNEDKFTKHLNGNKLYTEYNPYTLTSRPSNRHGGVNFSALNKNDGTREIFIPSSENHKLIQMDYDAYHVRLIGKLVDEQLPETSAHEWLAKKYKCSYEEAKTRTFRIVYGNITNEDRKIKLFDKTDIYIKKLWGKVIQDGYFETYNGRKIRLKWIENPNPQKVFNYYLQSMETELNMDILDKLYKSGLGEHLMMYTYDSFVFDVPKSTDTKTLTEIRNVLQSNGFPVKGTMGDTYNDL